MSSSNTILALDIGASKLTLAEFSVRKGQSAPELVRYAVEPRPASDGAESLSALAPVLASLKAKLGVKSAPLTILLPGQSVFPRFQKLPPGSADMADKLVQEEAAQNLPFGLDQIVWDYQQLGENLEGELEVLILATKKETATEASALASAADLPLAGIQAGPLALSNAVCRSVEGQDGCTLVLDIGAKTTDLLFLEGNKVFMRTIPVAGGTITNEIARNMNASVEDAEAYKIESGYVALGGTYGNPDDEQADHVSKIIRNVVTRLHSEVMRSINFYRSQQGGSAPARILLTGGSSALRYLDVFFREKLGVEVVLFNPFEASLAAAPQFAGRPDAWGVLSPLSGAALDSAGLARLHLNLVPPEIVEEQRLTRRIPFFIGAAVCLVLSVVCWLLSASQRADFCTESASLARTRVNTLRKYGTEIEIVQKMVNEAKAEQDFFASAAYARGSFAKMFDAIRSAMFDGSWLTAFRYAPPAVSDIPDNAPVSDSEGGAAPSYGTVTLTLKGFKSDLERVTKTGSSAELFVARLEKTGFFVPGGSDVLMDRTDQKERLEQIEVTLRLARPVGIFAPVWNTPIVPVADDASAAAVEEGSEVAAAEDAAESADGTGTAQEIAES